MKKVTERILRILGFREDPQATQDVLLDFLSRKPNERHDAVETVDFLEKLRT